MRRPSRGAGRAADVEVVLVEDERVSDRAPRAHAAATPAAGPPAERRPGFRPVVGRRRSVAVLAVVVLLGVAGVLQSRQQAVVAAALEAQPGLLRSVHVLPVEQWRLPGAWVAGLGERDVLVTTPDGPLQAVDPKTGAVRWDTGRPPPGGSVWCSALDRTPDGSALTRVPPDVRPAAFVVCEEGRWVAGRLGTRVRHTTATVHDAGTGAVVATREVDGGLLVSDVAGEDLLHAWADASGRVSVARWDPRTGAPRWTFRSEHRVTDRRSNGVAVHRGAGTVSFVGSGTVTVDLASGEERDRPGTEAQRHPVVVGHLPDGAAVVVRGGGVGASSAVVGTDGATRWSGTGDPLLPEVRTGTAPPALLLHRSDRGTVVAVDPTTGSPLWESPLALRGPNDAADLRLLTEVGPVAVLTDTVEAWAVDLAGGRELWRLPLADVPRLHPLTDGTVVALPVQDGTPAGALLAVDGRSGAELWRTPLPDGTKGVRSAHGILLVESGDGITALG
ncbi:PQQ-binding-like beta-propeller repeat protein [Actinotalea sp. Marseille-Q4924]|uniref:outer membrane protein assembly factor BamB family protein n=1 Tax=Actinotalea sp. Marseille-Q4924 TaxID=2866571 RepID=UPI001CE43A51|nr:PQQ-binding-like beta-propeller repeat protein [Actinotalea sp. Marseille-Q4924]